MDDRWFSFSLLDPEGLVLSRGNVVVGGQKGGGGGQEVSGWWPREEVGSGQHEDGFSLWRSRVVE